MKVEFREITGDDRAGLDVIAELHMELLGYGPMAGLGERFVREICYRAHMADELLRVVVATADGRPAGFVAYTPYSATFHRSGLGRHFFRAGLETMLAILSNPSRVVRLVRALRVLGSRRGELDRIDDTMGEVVCIAVRPEYLKAGFARASGVRLSDTLVTRAASYLRRAGIERMRMLVDADNRPVLMLYHLMGARFTPCDLGGTPTVEVEFDLSAGGLGEDPGIPVAWSAAAAAAESGGSWREYWESISERRKVFEAEARDHVERLATALQLEPGCRLLDFGCGFGYTARFLSPRAARVTLWDASASVRRRARFRTAHLANVDYADLTSPASDTQGAFDLITVHSVVQYMNEADLRAWLGRWRSMLAPGGRLVLSDLIQPRTAALPELLGFLAFSFANGFFLDALFQGLREAWGYARARSTRPLQRVSPDELRMLAADAGLRVEILPSNLSHRQGRVSAVLRA